MEPESFVVAIFCVFLLAVAGVAGSHVMRDSIQKECDRFGQTSIAGKQYTCTAVGKTDTQPTEEK